MKKEPIIRALPDKMVTAEATLVSLPQDDGTHLMAGKLKIERSIVSRDYIRKWQAMWKRGNTGGSMRELAKMNWTATEMKVLMMIIDLCSQDNRITIKPTELARDLDVSRQSIYNAIENFKTCNILIKDDDQPGYILNPRVGWFGSPHTGERKIRDAEMIKPPVRQKSRPEFTLMK